MLASIALLLTACLSATWLAYGMDPAAVRGMGGVNAVTLTRQLQWILLITSILPALVLILRVAIGRARAPWLLGLAIVVAMLFIRFGPTQQRPVRVLDAASLPTIAEAKLDNEEEFVVGLLFNDTAYAFPYRSLYRTPVVQVTDREKRLIVIFSPYANSATALDVSREVRAGDLEFVASPGNSSLVYNKKYGEFIVGVTGQTPNRTEPTGVRDTVPTWRMPLAHWRRLHPASRLMLPLSSETDLPAVPIMPKYPPAVSDSSLPPQTPIVLIRTKTPAALLAGGRYDEPVHTKAGDVPLALWRRDGILRAFNRTVDQDLFLTFRLVRDRTGREQITDDQTNSTWSVTGRAIDGELKGKQLTPVPIEENVYWGVSREWWPDLQLIRAE